MEFSPYQRQHKTFVSITTSYKFQGKVFQNGCEKNYWDAYSIALVYTCCLTPSFTIHSVDRCGRITASVCNPAVSSELLLEVYQWSTEGTKLDDIIERLRLRTVPRNYVQTIHTWTEDTMFLMSILSKLT